MPCPAYQPRDAERGVLYRVIEAHLDAFLDAAVHHVGGARLLASTAARVLSWYFRTRDLLDSPVQFTLQAEATRYGDDPWQITSRWDIAPSARRRETLLAEVSTIGLALARVPERDSLILVPRYDPSRGISDEQLAKALHCDREGVGAAHAAALVALGEQLVKMGLIHMNGKPTWAG